MSSDRKYILRTSFQPKDLSNRHSKGDIDKSNLFNLSNIGLNWDRSLIRSSLAMGTTESNKDDNGTNYINSTVSPDFYDSIYAKTQDITRVNNKYICFFDNEYSLRRQYLRDFAANGEINFVLETIADEAIIYDENNYFAYLDIDQLKSHLKEGEDSKTIIKQLQTSYKRVYQMFGWESSNDAWNYVKKFLTDGFLAFEILFDYDENHQAKNIIGFKELDPVTLQPDIVKDEVTHQDIKVWYQYKDDAEKEHIIPDSNLIYISWSKGSFPGRISYVESLTRTFNMLRQLENSRIIWNIQNAQKRIKIVVPVGYQNENKARMRIKEIEAEYAEETEINDTDGTMTVNGEPNFSFNKTYVFPSVNGSQTDINEMGIQGYDLGDTEQLKYWWRRFILESKLPANRFLIDPQSPPNNSMGGEASITREEAAFGKFIGRIQSIFKEILIKATWVQFCLKQPLFAQNNIIKSCLGLKYNNDNIFELSRIRQIANDGATTVQTLSGFKDGSGQPYFSMDFLVHKFLGLTEEDLKQNEKYKFGNAKKAIDMEIEAKAAQGQQPQSAPGMGADMGMGAGAGMEPSGGMTGSPGEQMPDMTGGNPTPGMGTHPEGTASQMPDMTSQSA
mgnify:FL=1